MRAAVLAALLWAGVVAAQGVIPGAGGGGGGGSTGCGVDTSCVAPDFSATTASGPGFQCNNQTASCVKTGPGACNIIGTDSSGNQTFGAGCTSAYKATFGAATEISGGGTMKIINGALLLNLNTFLADEFNAVDIIDPEGLRINNGEPISRMLRQEVTIDVPELGNLGTYTSTTTITGAQPGDTVILNPSSDCTVPNGFAVAYTQVTVANTVMYSLRNGNNAASIDPAPCAYIFRVMR